MNNYIAIDQYGDIVKLFSAKYPRKALLEKLGYKSASKIYQDKKNGTVAHVGYIVGGMWYSLYEIKAVEVLQ